MLFFSEMDVSEMKKRINEFYRVPDPSPVRGSYEPSSPTALFCRNLTLRSPGLRLRGFLHA